MPAIIQAGILFSCLPYKDSKIKTQRTTIFPLFFMDAQTGHSNDAEYEGGGSSRIGTEEGIKSRWEKTV